MSDHSGSGTKAHGEWMPLGGADEQNPAPEGSVEAWGRSADNQPDAAAVS